MSFSVTQIRKLQRDVRACDVRTREVNGRELSYIEGWHAIAEANRIFGFDAMHRETLESRCVLARDNRGTFNTIYVAKVRITVRCDKHIVVRDGYGSGEAHSATAGEAHDKAIKTAETDATKRALATFGKPFGLALYRKDKNAVSASPPTVRSAAATSPPTQPRCRFASRTTTTPIPEAVALLRPAPRPAPMADLLRQDQASALPPSDSELPPTRIDKSQLAIGEPKRLRDKAHLKFVASQPCLICGRQPSDPLSHCGSRSRGRLASR